MMLRAKICSGPLLALIAASGLVSCARAHCPASDSPASATAQELHAPAIAAAPSAQPQDADPLLVGFSFANCLSLYFQQQGWDAEGIGNISGGYVEIGDKPAEAYERLAAFIRDYHPPLQTKQKVDPDLVRCFHLQDSSEWRELVKR
jgi:hypothetical protein